MFITVIESNLGQFVNDTNPFISENVALHLKKNSMDGEKPQKPLP